MSDLWRDDAPISTQKGSQQSHFGQSEDGVDDKHRDHQAVFRKDRSCTDQIATLRIIVEQSMEWDSFMFINL